MKNKTVAQFLVGSVAISILTAIFESSLTYETTESLYMIAGLGMLAFGTYGSIKLYNSKD